MDRADYRLTCELRSVQFSHERRKDAPASASFRRNQTILNDDCPSRPEVGPSKNRRTGFGTSSTPIVTRLRCSTPSPRPGAPMSASVISFSYKQYVRGSLTEADIMINSYLKHIDDGLDVCELVRLWSLPRLAEKSAYSTNIQVRT